jgi:hypothetical protein
MDLPTYLKGEYSDDYQEQLNQSLRQGLVNGVYNQEFTNAQITQLLAYTTRPIIKAGTVFFSTTDAKLKVVVQAANPNTLTNGVVETITSA